MKKTIFIVVFIIATIGLAFLGSYVYNSMQPAKSTPVSASGLKAPIEIPDEGIVNFQEVTDTEKPILAMFYVDWCTYCRRFMPVFGEIAKDYKDKYTFAIINCDMPENYELAKEYHIAAFPTIYIVDNKYDYSTVINPYFTSDKELVKKELDKYFNLRSRIK